VDNDDDDGTWEISDIDDPGATILREGW